MTVKTQVMAGTYSVVLGTGITDQFGDFVFRAGIVAATAEKEHRGRESPK